MCWEDVKLHKTANGVEYLEFNERQLTKTRTGSDYSNVRAVPPKMFATDETERDPVAVYKFFCQEETRGNESRRCSLLSGLKQRFKGRLASKKRLVQVLRCWRKQTQRFNENNGSESGNLKRQASKSQRQKDNDPDAK